MDSKTAGHTPTPWTFWFDMDGDHAIAGADGLVLAVTVGVDDLPKEVDEANAALICSAVNSHEALREALRRYGVHDKVCPEFDQHGTQFNGGFAYDTTFPCTCGLAQALALAEEGE